MKQIWISDMYLVLPSKHTDQFSPINATHGFNTGGQAHLFLLHFKMYEVIFWTHSGVNVPIQGKSEEGCQWVHPTFFISPDCVRWQYLRIFSPVWSSIFQVSSQACLLCMLLAISFILELVIKTCRADTVPLFKWCIHCLLLHHWPRRVSAWICAVFVQADGVENT